MPLRRRALLALLPAGAFAASCGFEPMHGAGSPTRGLAVAVDRVPGLAGFALRERLVERLGAPEVPEYRLAVAVDLRQESAAITQDNVTTRYVLLGSAAFSLIPLGAAEPAVAETVTARTAWSAPASDTATIFAARAAALDAEERLARTLADRIVLRLALYAGAAPAAG